MSPAPWALGVATARRFRVTPRGRWPQVGGAVLVGGTCPPCRPCGRGEGGPPAGRVRGPGSAPPQCGGRARPPAPRLWTRVGNWPLCAVQVEGLVPGPRFQKRFVSGS